VKVTHIAQIFSARKFKTIFTIVATASFFLGMAEPALAVTVTTKCTQLSNGNFCISKTRQVKTGDAFYHVWYHKTAGSRILARLSLVTSPVDKSWGNDGWRYVSAGQTIDSYWLINNTNHECGRGVMEVQGQTTYVTPWVCQP